MQSALRTVLAGRTALIIAHRLSTVEIADRVLVLDPAGWCEDGPPARLLAGGGAGSPGCTRAGGTAWPDARPGDSATSCDRGRAGHYPAWIVATRAGMSSPGEQRSSPANSRSWPAFQLAPDSRSAGKSRCRKENMVFGGRHVSQEAEDKHAADVALAGKFTELLDGARAAEARLRQAQARRAPLQEQRDLGKAFDAALTEAMRVGLREPARGHRAPRLRRLDLPEKGHGHDPGQAVDQRSRRAADAA